MNINEFKKKKKWNAKLHLIINNKKKKTEKDVWINLELFHFYKGKFWYLLLLNVGPVLFGDKADFYFGGFPNNKIQQAITLRKKTKMWHGTQFAEVYRQN